MEQFWQNNDRARALFDDLLERSGRAAYDDDYLAVLDDYQKEAPDHPHLYVFAARYMLAHGDAAAAADYGERAFLLRPANHAVWDVLSRAYTALGRYDDALVMQGYAENLYRVPISLNIPSAALTPAALDRLSVALGVASYAPFAVCRMSYSRERGLSGQDGLFAREFLPVSPHISPPYYVGVYAEQEPRMSKSWLLDTVRRTPGAVAHAGGDFTFDIIRGEPARGRIEIDLPQDMEIVLPVIGTADDQKIRFETSTVNDTTWLNPDAPNFFRLSERTAISSDRDYIVGTPVRIGHDPSRRRLVLNILVDALAWSVVRGRFKEEMPNAHDFFSKGLIFDNHFSVAEYTYPSLATIETGMYPHHSGLVSGSVAIELRPDRITLSERMKERGYWAANLAGCGDGIYNGATRGYDRLIVTTYRQHAYAEVERLIRHLEGLPDTDHFIFLHALDVHAEASEFFQFSSSVQQRLPLADRLSAPDERVPSPYLVLNALSGAAFWQGVRDADRALGTLFSYLERHYSPDDYIVSLYSDHGISIFNECEDIANPAMTHAAWMMRGAGVPEGVRADELTSAVDIYPTLGALCDFSVDAYVDGVLPKVFGGTGREIAFSNSLFPTKAYYLAARSETHTLRLMVANAVEQDGTVDLSRAEVKIYPRDHEGEADHAVDSAELRAFFYPRVRAFLRGISNNGEVFNSPQST
ncbi:sulfatase-like hydrolase/transferase [Selenomonas sp. F0473]|uniref:sulfatase-like hydrolase/transferase n=1 Tax=Selenomonas sp. F0473 TaxID=999423 RepID=UPI00029E20F2|nr:sulfatase-like hydrolase/transferase [Selenomonas sp. F0473]EKU71237.1 hypothetical protein HMPREF9161_01331 [Selenomonas sp. F0473]